VFGVVFFFFFFWFFFCVFLGVCFLVFVLFFLSFLQGREPFPPSLFLDDSDILEYMFITAERLSFPFWVSLDSSFMSFYSPPPRDVNRSLLLYLSFSLHVYLSKLVFGSS